MERSSQDYDALRPGELAAPLPARRDAHLVFIGRIQTPFTMREDCPRQGHLDGPVCRLEIDAHFAAGLAGIEEYPSIEVLYWMHEARRDLLTQSPRSDGVTRGTFALRSPLRPNPIATQIVRLVRREGAALVVTGLDCLNGTPLLDVKPDRCLFTPKARTVTPP